MNDSAEGKDPVAKKALPEGWAQQKTDDMLRNLLADTSGDDNDSGLSDAVVGRLFSTNVRINGFELNLPPGNWAQLARFGITGPNETGVGYFIGRIELRRLVGAVRVFAQRCRVQPGKGFERVKGYDADDPNNIFAYNEDLIPFQTQGAWAIYSVYTPPLQQWENPSIRLDPFDRAAARDMSSKGVSYPQDFVGVRFVRAETWGMLEANYLFSPETENIVSSTVLSLTEADWHASRIGRFPEKMAYVDRVKDWATASWPQFKTKFLEGQ